MRKGSYKSWALFKLSTKPLLLVLSGPSGVGKDAVLARMKELGCPLRYVTTVTTRPQRIGERDNVDYRFVSTEGFQELISRGELLEWANVYGNWYGVPRASIKQALDEGCEAIVKVDIQGATTIKAILPRAVFIFLMSPSREELSSRLRQRHTESASELELRLKAADEEIEQLSLFDYIVFNRQDDIDQAVSDIEAIIRAEKSRVAPRKINL